MILKINKAQGDCTLTIVDSLLSSFQVTMIPGTNVFLGVVNQTCDTMTAFCPCSMVSRAAPPFVCVCEGGEVFSERFPWGCSSQKED